MSASLALVAVVLLAACGSDDENGSGAATQAETTAQKVEAPGTLIEPGKLTVCSDISFPPMEYYEGGDKTPKGFDIAVASAVAEAWGVEPVFKNTNFDGILPALSGGRCDVAWSAMFIDPERTKSFGAIPYFETGTVLLVEEGNPAGITSPDDLSGKTVAAQSGTTLLEDARKLAKEMEASGKEPPNVQAYPDATDLIQQLVVGRADAAVTQDTEAAYRSTQNPGQFEVAYSYPDKETFGIYFGKDNTEFGDALRKALQQLSADGTLEQIAEDEGLSPEGLVIE